METAKRIIRENKLASAMAAASATSSLPYLIGTLPYATAGAWEAAACASMGAAVWIPLSFYTGLTMARTYKDYSWDREDVLANPKRFVFQTAKLGASLGITCCVGVDLAASLFMLPFSFAPPAGVGSGFSGFFNAATVGRLGLSLMFASQWGMTGGAAGIVTGALVYLLKK